MSVVAFPFKSEHPDVVAANLRIAARHERVRQVWAIAAGDDRTAYEVAAAAEEIWKAERKPVIVVHQQRLGDLRPGKGDAMNTGIRAAAEAGVRRLHFYDADITNFDRSWIDGAEAAADRGFEVVRHRFPRSATDAMITWMVTRPALAMIFPGTVLPGLGQPLGGEMLISSQVIERLVTDEHVLSRSDWGIDTILTHATTTAGVPLYEHNVTDGKRHALYGSLDEIRDMALECLDAARSLRGRPGPPPDLEFERDPPSPVPGDLKKIVGYDLARTLPLLTSGWTDTERALLESVPGADRLRDDAGHLRFELMDAGSWGPILAHMLDNFDLSDEAWRSLAFHLWLARVLAYTTNQVPKGFDAAMRYLEDTIRSYEFDADHDVRP